MRISKIEERHFYEIEAYRNGWSKDELARQYGSSLYERLSLSRNKEEVMRLATEGQMLEKPEDIFKRSVYFRSFRTSGNGYLF